jgi:dCMP deaminase
MDSRRARDSVLMDCAYAFQVRSTCIRKVGAVIALDGRILSTGYNGTPAGMPHCDHTCNDNGCYSLTHPHSTETITHGPACPAVAPCLRTVHAETNAIIYAARHGVRISGGTLYTTVSPCFPCALVIVNAGLVRVVYDTAYRDSAGIELLHEAGIELRQLTKA